MPRTMNKAALRRSPIVLWLCERMTRPNHASRRWFATSTLLWMLVALFFTNLAWSLATARWVDHDDLFFRQHFDLGVTIYERQPPRIRQVVRVTSATRTAYWVGDRLYPPMNYIQAAERSAESLMPAWCPRTITLPPGVISTENKSLTYVDVGWPFRLLWCRATSAPSSIVLTLGESKTVGGYRTHEQPPPHIWPVHPLWSGQLATFALTFPIVVVLQLLMLQSRNAYRRFRHRCTTCGYNLHLNTSGVCPECGAAITPRAAT